ncbi:MAG: methyltransferase domain-containing protein [Deltaproteobacteria bacterium]|nr:methyltransferase domain-containing protein [Deltaproteobacteria bacterium]
MSQLYDRIGIGYAAVRRPDPRIAARVSAALADCESLVNVGAGTGSYEPRGRTRLAIDPSSAMLAQRAATAAPAVRGRAEALPLADRCVDAALAVLTLHHWSDWRAGLDEMARVSRRRVVVLSWDPDLVGALWLARDYLPEGLVVDRSQVPALAECAAHLPRATIETLPIPADCSDGFCGAYWRRPDAYLDPDVRRGISLFAALPSTSVAAALERLRTDLADGAWRARYADLLDRDSIDLGYRLICWDI